MAAAVVRLGGLSDKRAERDVSPPAATAAPTRFLVRGGAHYLVVGERACSFSAPKAASQDWWRIVVVLDGSFAQRTREMRKYRAGSRRCSGRRRFRDLLEALAGNGTPRKPGEKHASKPAQIISEYVVAHRLRTGCILRHHFETLTYQASTLGVFRWGILRGGHDIIMNIE